MSIESHSLARWDPARPFHNLPLLPPAGEIESKAVLRRCIGAHAALAELKQAAVLIPNQSMLINTLPLLEAQASSEIENVVTTTDRLFQHLGSEGRVADSATKEALRYRHALMESFTDLTRPIGTCTAEAICSRIRGVEMQVRRVPGTKLANEATGEVIYTPPGRSRRPARAKGWPGEAVCSSQADDTAHYR